MPYVGWCGLAAPRPWSRVPALSVKAHAPVAQLDRALPSEGRGHRFESCRVRQPACSGTPHASLPLRADMDQHVATKSNGSLLKPPPAAEAFYSEVLRLMADSQIPFLVSGTYALASYTGIDRPTKDVDVFAKAGDALKILHFFKEHGFDVEIVDDRWLYRITREDLFVDVI